MKDQDRFDILQNQIKNLSNQLNTFQDTINTLKNKEFKNDIRDFMFYALLITLTISLILYTNLNR